MINGKGSADAGEPIAEALRLLDLFASAGAEAFDITHTNLQQEKRGFRPAQSLAQARQSMPYLVPSAARRQNNLIVRPRAGADVTLVQLDDLAPDALAHIAPAAFLILRTSPRGQQAWVAVTNAPRGFAARLKEGTGADKEASGATRVAGTANFKPAYAPNFPRILIDAAQPGLRVTTQTLDAMGVVAPARPVPAASPSAVAFSGGLRTRKWPSYARCLEGAPRSAPAAIPSAPVPILSGARSRSPGATASKRLPIGCWKKAARLARTAKPMPGRPPSMPTTPPGNATPCHGGDRPGDEER